MSSLFVYRKNGAVAGRRRPRSVGQQEHFGRDVVVVGLAGDAAVPHADLLRGKRILVVREVAQRQETRELSE